MKKVDINDLEIGKLYSDTNFIGGAYNTIVRYLGVRDGERILKHVSGRKYPFMNGDEIPFGLGSRSSFYEIEEAPIEKMKEFDIKNLEIGKLYKFNAGDGNATMRYLGVRYKFPRFGYVSGFESPYVPNAEISFTLDTRASFWEVEEAPIEKMKSDMNSFFAIIDSAVAKLKATDREIENLKQKP